MRKKVVIGGTATAALLLIALGIYLSGWGTGLPMFGNRGQGHDDGKTSFISTSGESSDGVLVVVVQGSQYLVNGNPQSLDEILSAAEHAKPKDSGSRVVVKKKGDARFLTVDKLQKELDARKIKYRFDDDF